MNLIGLGCDTVWRYARHNQSQSCHTPKVNITMSIEPATAPDPLLPRARALLLAQQNPSVAFLQRMFKIGYQRATALMQSLEGDIVTPPDAQGWRRMMGTDNLTHDAPHHRPLAPDKAGIALPKGQQSF